MTGSAYVAVALGGAVGASARYLVSGLVYTRFGVGFPYGTLAVNVVGCFLIGIVMEMGEGRYLIPPGVRLFLTVGLLGGFTTFSTFSYETLGLMRDGQFGPAAINAVGSVALGLVAAWGGMVVGRGV